MFDAGDRSKVLRGVVALGACMLTMFLALALTAGDEGTQVKFSFALPAGEVYSYEAETYFITISMGREINRIQSYKADLSFVETTEQGTQKVKLAFIEAESSLIIGDEILDWTPPLDLNGVESIIEVSSSGEVLDADPTGGVTGLDREALREVVELWFVKLPDTVVCIGETWREDIEELSIAEDAPPEMKGYIDYTLKKIERKNDIEVARIEAEGTVEINRATEQGMLVAEEKIEWEMYIALDGGFIVEAERTSEIKGKILYEEAGDEEEADAAFTQFYEIKLKKQK